MLAIVVILLLLQCTNWILSDNNSKIVNRLWSQYNEERFTGKGGSCVIKL